jgi:hypothetical protein
MPSTTERQRAFMGAELARKRAGKKTETGMNESQLRDFAKKSKGRRRPTGAAHRMHPTGVGRVRSRGR